LDIARFPDNFIIRLTYRSERRALEGVLPAGLQPAGEPLITFMYRHSRNVDWVPAGQLNAFGATISVTYRGAQDEVSGAYWPFLWEDDAMAVILGREVFGVAKLYADISNPQLREGVWHGRLSEGGRPLIDLSFTEQHQADGAQLEALREQARQARVIGWKHIPSPNMKSADLSYPTLFQSPNQIRAAAFGRGAVHIHVPDPIVNLWNRHVIEALRSIPLLELVQAVRLDGSGEHRIAAGRQLI
jgi:hypothetical protein